MLELIQKELSRWDGVHYRIERGGKHCRLVMQVDGRERFVTFTSTRTDPRGEKNKISDVRRVLHTLGAQRNKA